MFNNKSTKRKKISNPDILIKTPHEKEFGLFDSVFHEVSNAIAIISNEQQKNTPVIMDVNHHFELVTGYQFDDIKGRHLYDFLAESLSKSNQYIIESALKSRQTAVLSCPWIKNNGDIIKLNMTIRPFSGDNSGSRFICVLREINNTNYTRDKAAKEIKQNLISAMHHNFKTPLNGILGYSEVIMSELMGPIGQESYKNYAQDIHGAGQDLLHLIDNLLDLKELETGEFDLHEENFILKDMISECFKKLSLEAEKNNITLIYNNKLKDIIRIFGDKSRLQQVIHSLLTNALKFTASGGKIIITTEQGNGGFCLISCEDNGSGMSSQQLAKAFCHDTHLSNIYSSPTVGIGFGLSYVRQIIEKHQGTVSIISSVDQGTKVTLDLPPERLN
ncbi:MAG: PAS domain-containing sensor histidine kinase [Emcibacter sp.]|nr:PAS domain-containing sensor histidine kinase [Emcibacter sp.]